MEIVDRTLDLSIAANFFLLGERGYADEAIAMNGIGDEHFLPESAVIIPETHQRLAFIQMEPNLERSEELSRNYLTFLERSNLNVPVYIFIPSQCRDRAQDFRIFVLKSSGDWDPILKQDLPSYDSLRERALFVSRDGKIIVPLLKRLRTFFEWIWSQIGIKVVVGVLVAAILVWLGLK